MSLFWAVLLTTFIVEDWAIAGSLLFVTQGKMTWLEAFLACFLGISLGDVLLFVIGRLAHHIPWLSQKNAFKSVHKYLSEPRQKKRLTWAIIASRALPGTRFLTYTGAGLAGYSLFGFMLLTPITVGLWVLLAMSGGGAFLKIFSENIFTALIAMVISFALLKKWLPLVLHPWKRKALPHFWRRWLIFEFWPAWFAYAPIIPYYLFLSMKHRSLIHPFYANPDIPNAGLIGETKWEIQKYLDPKHPSTLKTLKFKSEASFDDVEKELTSHSITFPLIAKPNVGQRGFAVRIIKDSRDLSHYVQKANFEFLIQQKSQFDHEAGIFYVRHPDKPTGELISITDKDFPFVIGDGKTKLGDLILQDPRARIVALLYFARHLEQLDTVIPKNQKYFISECGNHSQGAIFMDGQHLRTEKLLEEIDKIAKGIPNFYFGRFDVRYESQELLKQGLNFEIVEVNGAGADITHIYDEHTKVREAYSVMLYQWRLLFEIGRAARRRHGSNALVDIPVFLKEILRVNVRKHELSVSS